MVTPTEYQMLLGIVGVFVTILVILLGVLIVKRVQLSRGESNLGAHLGDSHQDKILESASEVRPSPSAKAQSSASLISDSLQSTRGQFWSKLTQALTSSEGEAQVIEQVEEVLYLSDLGPKVVEHFLGRIRSLSREQRRDLDSIKSFIQSEASSILNQVSIPQDLQGFDLKSKPSVFLIIGVNGAGKTTTIGKLAKMATDKGLKVLVAAGDTFRAAAGEQLAVWAERAQVEVFSPQGVKDPGAVAYEAVKKGQAEAFDLVLIDTAGRLHTSHNLMEELKKINRVIKKAWDQAPHHVLLVLDASGGQNAVIQAEQFNQAIPVTGLILTKLDGTAKGGMVLSAVDKIKAPIVWLGVGEKAEDLVTFKSEEFASALVSDH